MNRYLITCSTAWCGEEEQYTAIAYTEDDDHLLSLMDELAYDNFTEGTGIEGVWAILYPDVDEDDRTSEMEDKVFEAENEYFGATIEPWDEERPDEEWDWYKLVYDADDVNDSDVEVEDENEVEGT